MLIKPIPPALLIHGITIKPVVSVDARGNKTFGDPVAVTRVRVEPIKQRSFTPTEEQDTSQYKVFYDSVHSRPQGLTFPTGTVIEWAGLPGKALTVRESIPQYAGGPGAHHWEIKAD